jgi:DNA-directed RNA polymerase subunit beta'
MSRKQDLSMRSTIVPNQRIKLDEVAMPKEGARQIFRPHLVRELRGLGLTTLQAHEAIKTNDKRADVALERVMKDTPVLLKRDPVLHKFGVMSFKPKLSQGKAIEIHPLVTGGFNADFDGDTMAVFAPITTEAKEEAKRMLPSNNLFDPKNGNTMYVPGHEAMAGVHRLSQPGKKTGLKFSSEQTAAKALEDGKIRFDDQVKIGGKPTTVGKVMLDRALPKEMRGRIANSKQPVDKKFMGQMLKEVAETNPKAYPDVVQAWKDLGNDTSTKTGMTLSLDDIRANTKLREQFFAPYKKKEAQIKAAKGLTKREREEKIVDLYRGSIEKFDKVMYDDLRKRGSSMMSMLDSGGMGGSKRLAVKQMSGAPVMFEDAKGDAIPVPVLKSYSEGLGMADYMTGAQGARMGPLSKSQGTSAPGALSKRIINSTMNILVGTDDCKTGKGVLMDVKDPDLVDRSNKGR